MTLIRELYTAAPAKVQAAVIGFFILALIVQSYLGPKADWVESKRKRLLIKFDEALTFVGGFGTREIMEVEYAGTALVPDDHGEGDREDWVERQLYDSGFHRNLIAGKKYRYVDGHKQYADGSWAIRDSVVAKRQLHLHLFKASDGNFDIYVHEEPSVTRPLDHLYGGEQTYEDAKQRVRAMFDGDPMKIRK